MGSTLAGHLARGLVLLAALMLLHSPAGAQERPRVEVVPNIPHSWLVRSLAFSPDGARVLSGGDETRPSSCGTRPRARCCAPSRGIPATFDQLHSRPTAPALCRAATTRPSSCGTRPRAHCCARSWGIRAASIRLRSRPTVPACCRAAMTRRPPTPQRETPAWTPASRAHASRSPPRPAAPPLLAPLRVQTDQTHHRGQQARAVAVGDADGDQLSLCPIGILLPCGQPFRLAVHRLQIVLGKHRDCARGAGGSVMHVLRPVGAWNEIPRLDEHPVAVFFQGPGDPLSPRTIRLGVGDEKVPIGHLVCHVDPSTTAHSRNAKPR